MNPRYQYHEEAEEDIDRILSYFVGELKSKQTAEKFLLSLDKTCQLLAEMPYIGRKRDYPNPKYTGMRVFPVSGYRNYSIFYKPIENGILIARVSYARRDLEALFS